MSELNDRSALVTFGSSKVLVTDVDTLLVGDRVTLSHTEPLIRTTIPSEIGWNRYVAIHHIVATTRGEAIESIQRTPLMRWGADQWHHTDGFEELIKALLFQSDPVGKFGIILGTGLVLGLINRLLRSALSLMMRDSVNASLRFGLFLSVAFYLGFPLALLRYVVSLGCLLTLKNRWLRWSISVALLWLLNPFYLTSMAVLIPLFFQLMGLLKVHSLTRSLGFSVFQGFIWHRVFPLTTLSYGLLRPVFGGVIITLWMATVVPVLQPWVIDIANRLDYISAWLNQLWVVSGQASLPNILMLVSILRIGRRSPIWMASGFVVFLLWMPLLSAPWLATLSVVDVGQGNAVLITSPLNQSVVLIDTGRPTAYPQLKKVLDANGIDQVDALILTHDDADHAGNVDQLNIDYRIRKTVTTRTDLKLNAMWLFALDASVENPSENQSSLVYGLQWGGTRMIVMGDAEVANERALLARYPRLSADVVLIGHHGSATSTSEAWIGTLQPQVALISVGRNGYGHPSPNVLKTLSAFHVLSLSTLSEGTIRLMITPFGTIIITDSWKLKVLSNRV